ncbi:putative 40S ribosomal protein S27 [Colletotrichum sublineola]|nr:putative 40S ribosomal protein S27 [Colletotrichum sublineola]
MPRASPSFWRQAPYANFSPLERESAEDFVNDASIHRTIRHLCECSQNLLPTPSDSRQVHRTRTDPRSINSIRSVKMVLAVDLLNPSPASEARKHKLKTLVPAPRSFFMDVKCPGCFTITTVFSHAQTVVICQGCTTVLCQPTGGKARLTEGCSFRRK